VERAGCRRRTDERTEDFHQTEAEAAAAPETKDTDDRYGVTAIQPTVADERLKLVGDGIAV